MDGFSERCDETALPDGDINRLLELHKEYTENSLKYLSALEADKQNVKGFVKHPQTSRKYMPRLQPMEYKKAAKCLRLKRSDGIMVELKCPVCQSGNFATVEKFIQHLTNFENIPLFQDEDEVNLIKQYSDIIALEFGSVLPLSQQTLSAKARINTLEKRNIDPSRQLYISSDRTNYADEIKESHQNKFKFLRKRAAEEGENVDNLLKEITE